MGIFAKKKKKGFKKKSGFKKFWRKLSTKSKAGLIIFLLAVVGAASAYTLSLTDQSLQSHASLECNSNCERTCSRLKTAGQMENYNRCITKCEGQCDLVADDASHQVCHSPFASRFYSLSKTYKEKADGRTLGAARMAWLSRVFKASHIDISTETQFANWFELNCQVEDKTVPPPPACQPNWTLVIGIQTDKVGSTPNYYWPTGCKGRPIVGDAGCSQAQVQLSTTDLEHYKKWLAAGRPAITENLCGGGSTKAVIVPDISWETCIAADKYVILETYPATCETIIDDEVKVAVLGDQYLEANQCDPKPTCKEGDVLELDRYAGLSADGCPTYACYPTKDEPLTWNKCIAHPDSKFIESYPRYCVLGDEKIEDPNQSPITSDEKSYCDSDADCKDQTCYFPPMPPCREGLSCAQVMPKAYCVPKIRSVINPTPKPGCYYQKVQCIQAPCDPIEICPGGNNLSTPTTYTPPSPRPSPYSNEVRFDTNEARLWTQDFYIYTNNTFFFGHNTDIAVHSDPGTNTYTTLELMWTESGVPMRWYIYFKSDGIKWWATEMRVYDGSQRGDWIYFKKSNYFTNPINSSYTNGGDTYFTSDDGQATIYLKNPVVRAFK